MHSVVVSTKEIQCAHAPLPLHPRRPLRGRLHRRARRRFFHPRAASPTAPPFFSLRRLSRRVYRAASAGLFYSPLTKRQHVLTHIEPMPSTSQLLHAAPRGAAARRRLAGRRPEQRRTNGRLSMSPPPRRQPIRRFLVRTSDVSTRALLTAASCSRPGCRSDICRRRAPQRAAPHLPCIRRRGHCREARRRNPIASDCMGRARSTSAADKLSPRPPPPPSDIRQASLQLGPPPGAFANRAACSSRGTPALRRRRPEVRWPINLWDTRTRFASLLRGLVHEPRLLERARLQQRLEAWNVEHSHYLLEVRAASHPLHPSPLTRTRCASLLLTISLCRVQYTFQTRMPSTNPSRRGTSRGSLPYRYAPPLVLSLPYPLTRTPRLAFAYHSLCRVQLTFQDAHAFNQPLEAWNVSRVTTLAVRAASHPLHPSPLTRMLCLAFAYHSLCRVQWTFGYAHCLQPTPRGVGRLQRHGHARTRRLSSSPPIPS